jgi:NADH dehydrogenase
VDTATLSPADIAWPIRGILSRQRNVRVLTANVDAVDAEGRVVHSNGGTFAYDHLVVATGATHAYFGHPDWAPHAPGLKRIEDATEIRRRILLAFERAELSADPSERDALTTFVVVGGGPTGVEMAGAIADMAHDALPRDFRNVDPARARAARRGRASRARRVPRSAEPLCPDSSRTARRRGDDGCGRDRHRPGPSVDRGSLDEGRSRGLGRRRRGVSSR